jgi:hypothetical protein
VVSAASGVMDSSLAKSPNWQAFARWPLLEMKPSFVERWGSMRE